ncbi:MAG: TIGR04211 family SH3 domain-containing protein [Pseudomonadales bacterium]
MKKIALIMASLLVSSPLLAKTVYITDSFQAPMRTGQTNAYRIIAYPASGTAMEVLDVDKETGYTKVKTSKGTEGWVLSRYLVDQPIAKHRLAQVQKQLATLKEQNTELLSGRSNAEQNASELSRQNQALQNTNSKLEKELSYVKEVSGNAISINQRNQQLIEENQQLKNKIDLLSSDNERLKDDANNQFFMLGAGAILLGLVLGLVLPSLKPKRKDTGWV